MATFAFRGLDHQAAKTDTVRITLDGIDPPLELPQLLELRRHATQLLRCDTRFASATVIHTYLEGDGQQPLRVNATVYRAYLSGTEKAGASSGQRAAR
jgi:hypothetical protein